MKAMRVALMMAVAIGAGGCSSAPAPVPVAGGASDLGLLAGEWSGSYESVASGRNGSIVFKLSAGADTAYGDVVMIPRERREERLPAQDPSAGLPIARAPQVLSIAFVRAAGGGVTGELKTYRDPDCDCLAMTRFEGRIRGDDISGSYTTTPLEGGKSQTGTWKVTRKRP